MLTGYPQGRATTTDGSAATVEGANKRRAPRIIQRGDGLRHDDSHGPRWTIRAPDGTLPFSVYRSEAEAARLADRLGHGYSVILEPHGPPHTGGGDAVVEWGAWPAVGPDPSGRVMPRRQ